jgi:hypothetical protein
MSLDWQLRMAEMLLDMPIDLLCKPHPEGILKGQPQPVAEIAPVSYKPFESHLEWTDVFVFDRAESTTFWEAVCTDRPIVYLDAGLTEFIPQVRPLIENRCRCVMATFDERNRPVVDPEELSDAILGDHAPINLAPLRRLLAGPSKMQGTAG